MNHPYIITNSPFNPFPVMSLPFKARNSVLELQRNTGAPLALIGASTLAAMSLAIQGLVNVRRMPGLEGPVSAWYLVVAESGERKTAVDAKNFQPIHEFDKAQGIRFKAEMAQFKAAIFAWEAERKAIMSAITKATTADEPADGLKKKLADHIVAAPKKPKRVRLLYKDVTPAATKKAFNDNWRSIGLISNEGASLLTGQAMGDLSFVNSTWGGETIQVDRATQESIRLKTRA